jgi:hypothetical protein
LGRQSYAMQVVLENDMPFQVCCGDFATNPIPLCDQMAI